MLKAPEPLRFPTLAELASAEAARERSKQSASRMEIACRPNAPAPRGLFEELLGGDIDVLINDIDNHSEKYDLETRELVGVLRARNPRGPLCEAERQLLDLAVLDFVRASPRKDVPPARSKPRAVRAEIATDVRPFWWQENI